MQCSCWWVWETEEWPPPPLCRAPSGSQFEPTTLQGVCVAGGGGGGDAHAFPWRPLIRPQGWHVLPPTPMHRRCWMLTIWGESIFCCTSCWFWSTWVTQSLINVSRAPLKKPQRLVCHARFTEGPSCSASFMCAPPGDSEFFLSVYKLMFGRLFHLFRKLAALSQIRDDSPPWPYLHIYRRKCHENRLWKIRPEQASNCLGCVPGWLYKWGWGCSGWAWGGVRWGSGTVPPFPRGHLWEVRWCWIRASSWPSLK